ncbi:hypothetical protein CE91St44_06690 [Oscillospiraceae bacterium]|nr:hypothetical protein CE91St44_06690 [Oscillospiraceae bacterium]
MSGNLELIKRSYASSASGDRPGIVRDFSEKGVWIEMAGAPHSGMFTGPQEVLEHVFAGSVDEWERFACIPEDYFEDTERGVVVMVGHYEGVHKISRKSMWVRTAHVWRVEKGKIVRYEQFADTKLLWDAVVPAPDGAYPHLVKSSMLQAEK